MQTRFNVLMGVLGIIAINVTLAILLQNDDPPDPTDDPLPDVVVHRRAPVAAPVAAPAFEVTELADGTLKVVVFSPCDEGLRALRDVERISSLDVLYCESLGVPALQRLHEAPLRHLSLCSSNLHDGFVPVLSQFAGLESLEICEGVLSDAAIREIVAGKPLVSCVVVSDAATGEWLRSVVGIETLEHVGVGGDSLRPEHLSILHEIDGLKTLRLSGELTDAMLKPLSGLESMTILTLGIHGIDPEANLADLESIRRLKGLRLIGYDEEFSEEQLQTLGRLTDLEWLAVLLPITDDQYGRLKDNLPRTRVTADGHGDDAR